MYACIYEWLERTSCIYRDTCVYCSAQYESYVMHQPHKSFVASARCVRSGSVARVYECVHTYMRGSVCATTRNTLRTRTSKQTQSNQFARLIDFPSHGRCSARALRARVTARRGAARSGPNIERQCNAPYKSNPKLSFDYQANSRGRL